LYLYVFLLLDIILKAPSVAYLARRRAGWYNQPYFIDNKIDRAAMMVLEGWYFECGPVFEEYKLTKKQLDGTLKRYKIGLQ